MSCVKGTGAVIHGIWWTMIASVSLYTSALEGSVLVGSCMFMWMSLFVSAIAERVFKSSIHLGNKCLVSYVFYFYISFNEWKLFLINVLL